MSSSARPPDYVATRMAPPDPNGPAQFLKDGAWCGHGEPIYHVFDVHDGGAGEFVVYRPREVGDDDFRPNAVKLAPVSGDSPFLVYDPSKHPASLFASDAYSAREPQFAEALSCAQCRGTKFRVSAGFEVPSDSNSPNDTSWFALAAICVGCRAGGIVFDDETA